MLSEQKNGQKVTIWLHNFEQKPKNDEKKIKNAFKKFVIILTNIYQSSIISIILFNMKGFTRNTGKNGQTK